MYLRSLTLKGFKSFPDRTRLAFGPGVSVIVGPNGSGKSNVTDAVLWALGEQSPLAVRGTSMQDVIFAGGHGRASGSEAEVELVLDNGDGTLGVEFPEVSVSRRLDRAGDGEYRLNGARCRLVDVLEVLSDTGLGKEMHSVVSQGRVEAIVTSKPRDRRLLVEEAAGLGKHRKRRRRAQLKLERTQDNLDRALDVEREARSRLRPLKRQAEAAELHERLERQATEARWELARDDVRAATAALAEAEAAAAAARTARDAAEAELAEVARRREAAEEALARRSEHREALSGRAYGARSAGERIALRLESARAVAGAAAERAERAAAEIAALEAETAADPDDAGAEARITALEAERAALERDREHQLSLELEALDAERARAAAEADRLAGVVAERRAALAAADERCETARSERRETERVAEAARREAAAVGADLAAVNQFLRSHAGAPGGARALADELSVEAGLELALAAALGGLLGAAIVGDLDEGGRVLERAGRDGGVALVGATTAGGATPPGGAAPLVGAGPSAGAALSGGAKPPVPGARRLLDAVSGPADALAPAARLLAATWVVDDLAALPEGFAGVAVTPAGRVWSPTRGELRQVPAGGDDRVLAERNRRDALLGRTERAASAEATAAAGVARAGEAVQAADAAREEADRAVRSAQRERDAALEDERRARASIERRRDAPDEGPGAVRRAQLGAEIAAERRWADQIAAQRADRARRLEAARGRRARHEALAPDAARAVDALVEAAAAATATAEAFDAELAADRAAGETVAAELRACAQEEAAVQGRLRAHGEAVTQAEVRAQQQRDHAAEAGTELATLAERLGLAPEPAPEPLGEEERAALAGRLERLARRREQLGPVNPLAQDEYAAALAHVEELEGQREDLEAALRELRDVIRDTDRQIRETFEATFAAAAENFAEVAAYLFPGGRGRLRLVREDAGPRPVLGGAEEEAETEGSEAGDPEAEPEEDALGVEIEITPAGKATKRLSLLSGGEKSLTALAFLFAVFLARPCPFYILDEVEAALDDLNIARFLELLRRYADRAQFIVVTHQKRTMEAADVLYGVSMAGDGVSKVISRRLPRDETESAGATAA
jgi:chromosome segregation protein